MNIRRQRVVIEYHAGDWLIMLDAGDVYVRDTPEAALAFVRRAAARGNRDATVTRIEWRNTPAGFVAPEAQ